MGKSLEISVLLFVLFGFLGFVPFGLFILQLQKQVSIQMGCDLGHVVELCRIRSQPVGVWPRLRHVLQLPALPPASEPVSSPCCLSTLTRMSHHVGRIYITHTAQKHHQSMGMET